MMMRTNSRSVRGLPEGSDALDGCSHRAAGERQTPARGADWPACKNLVGSAQLAYDSDYMKLAAALFALVMPFSGSLCLFADAVPQTSSGTAGTVRGMIIDPANAAVPGATVVIQNPVSHYTRTVQCDARGGFEFLNVPFNNYHIAVTAQGFANGEHDVDVRSPIAIDVKISLALGTASTTMTVHAEGADLVETDPVTHTDVDRGLFDKLTLESQSSSLSSLVTLASPGVAADSNGLFHGLGDHAQNSFSVDGQPITDQQSKVFSNQLPVDAVQSMEVIEGAPPAEYGDKTSLVIVATTRSGLGMTQAHGSVNASYGSFGTPSGSFDVGFGNNSVGNFVAVNGMNTGRFLDGPEFGVLHDHGNQQNIFDRLDFKPSASDTVNLNLQFTRSWFQTPNSYDMQSAAAWSGGVVDNGGIGPNGQLVPPADQRSTIRTFNIAPNWTRAIGGSAVLTFGGWVRQDQYRYIPSADPFADLIPDLQLESIGQNRSLTNLGGKVTYSYAKGAHNLKVGAVYQHTFLTERDTLGIVDPTFNPVCLNADGSPYTGASLTNPAGCTGQLSPNPSFAPLLGCYDLTRTGTLPASDGCPAATSAAYRYYGHADIKELSLFAQDTINIRNLTINLGVRADIYNGLAAGKQIEPRLGVAYNIKRTNTVLRVSYARTMETPFNENQVLASTGCNDPVINALMSAAGPCLAAPEGPGWRNEFHAGFSQAFGRYLVIDAEYIWKYTHRAFDFSVLGNSPITFPIEWASSKIPGFAIRASMPNFHGFSAFVVMSSVAARFFTPQISGIGATPGGSSVFRIDHDEIFNETTHLQYQVGRTGMWLGFNWRYDSGLVAGPVPCAGGNCANGPAGTDTLVDVSGLTADQQYQAGLYCGGVFATPTTPISPTGLCPASLYGSKLVKIPAAGSEDDDHNPARIAARNLFDVSVGDDNLFHGDHYKWSLRFAVVNLTNKVALYNFLSTFSGTHYVTPRAMTVSVGFHF